MSDLKGPVNTFDTGAGRFSSSSTISFIVREGTRTNVSYAPEFGKCPSPGDPAPYWYPAPGLPIGVLVCFGPTNLCVVEDNHSFTEAGRYTVCFNLFKEAETSVGLLFAGTD